MAKEENLEIRKAALEMAIEYIKGTLKTYSADDTVEIAVFFERYLKGK